MTRSELKLKSKGDINGKIGTFFIVTVLLFIITFSINLVSAFIPIIGNFLSMLCSSVLSYGLISIYLNCIRTANVDIKDLFSGFNSFFRISFTMLLQSIYIFLWSLLFLIPGCIKTFSYALVPYILIDHPELSYNSAISLSRKMMDGHKLDLFILHLSFIGWLFLCAITFGLASIYVLPYMSATTANFYEDLKNSNNIEA